MFSSVIIFKISKYYLEKIFLLEFFTCNLNILFSLFKDIPYLYLT